MDQKAGVWPVKEGGGSGSSGPAVPEDVEESEPVKKLVVPTAPTGTDREEHTASGHAVFRIWCRECCIGTWPTASAPCQWTRDHDSSDCH